MAQRPINNKNRKVTKSKKTSSKKRNSNTRSKRRRRRSYRRLKKMIFVFILIICICIGLFVKRNSISLWRKGYSSEERKILLELDKDDLQEYLDLDQSIDISKWEEYDNKQHFYDYYLYKKKHKSTTDEEVVNYIDSFYDIYSNLNDLGYSKKICRNLMSTFTISDFQSLIDNNIKYSSAKEYLKINGCQATDIAAYVQSGLEPLSAVLTVTYPFIDSNNTAEYTYLVNSPSNDDVLIKKGFTLGADYVPDNLVDLTLPRDADSTNYQMREDAAQALENMAADAKKEGLYIGVRSGYRSYADQEEVYNYYLSEYGEEYTNQIASLPGSSEHQLGLGIDLTSQSVIDGVYGTFGDTEEYQWTIQNCYKYGYILRYPDNKTDITGAMNEPWHFRYVGVDVATEIHNNNWTLEEYIQAHGFSYSLTRQ